MVKNINWAECWRGMRHGRFVVDSISRSAVSFIKVFALGFLVYWIVTEREFIKERIGKIIHFEAAGVKIALGGIEKASEEMKKLAADPLQRKSGFNLELGQGAIQRASRVAEAIVGAKILWVDDNESGNLIEQSILENLQIHVTYLSSTEQALSALRRTSFDLIVSDIWREADPGIKLVRCRAHYFDFPSSEEKKKFQDLAAFNEAQNSSGPAGFSMAEQVRPNIPIIFYSDRSTEIARTLCGDRITNRADVLLHAIVGLLEEHRWHLLRRESGSTGLQKN